MRRLSYLSHTIILLLLTIAFYHTQQWKEQQRETLRELRLTVENDYVEKSSALFNSLRLNVIHMVHKEVLPSLLNESIYKFSADQIQEYQLRSEFDSSISESLQTDITSSLRTLLKENLPESMKEVSNEKEKTVKKYPLNMCGADKNLPANQKVLSYALYGYTQLPDKEIREMMNRILSSNLYHDWRVRIYHDGSFDAQTLQKYKIYKTLDFCDASKVPIYGDMTNRMGSIWRVIPLGDNSVDVICPRHIHSKILSREEDAVVTFVKSDKLLHIMRDHPSHKHDIVSNLWCIRTVSDRHRAKTFLDNLLKRSLSEKTSSEEELLRKVVWNGIGKKDKYIIQHDSFSCGNFKESVPFPTQRKDNREFVGCFEDNNCKLENLPKCPAICRPVTHEDWEYC